MQLQGLVLPHLLRQSLLTSPGISLLLRRDMSKRSILYGGEEGHDKKNEVRKLRWVRKHARRSTGEGWRTRSQGLPADPFKAYSLYTKPDWSFAEDGTPGYLSEAQRAAVMEMRDLCTDVEEALEVLGRRPEPGHQV